MHIYLFYKLCIQTEWGWEWDGRGRGGGGRKLDKGWPMCTQTPTYPKMQLHFALFVFYSFNGNYYISYWCMRNKFKTHNIIWRRATCSYIWRESIICKHLYDYAALIINCYLWLKLNKHMHTHGQQYAFIACNRKRSSCVRVCILCVNYLNYD